MIFVSHKLNEVKKVSDRVTVLRGGKSVGVVATADTETKDLARMMVGRDLVLSTRQAEEVAGETMLSVRDLRIRGDRGLEAVKGVSFEVRSGEVLGVAGVSGNGQRELAHGLVGLRPAVAGSVFLDGEDVTTRSVQDRIDLGMAYVPGNRLGMGLAPGLTTEENLGLKAYRRPPFSNGPRLRMGAFKEHGEKLIGKYDIRLKLGVRLDRCRRVAHELSHNGSDVVEIGLRRSRIVAVEQRSDVTPLAGWS